MTDALNYPFDPHELLRKKKSIKRRLQQKGNLSEKRIAIMGGSTTSEIKDMLELFLLQNGIQPVFYESGYDRYFEEIMFENAALTAFRPDIVYIHTTSKNITALPKPGSNATDVGRLFNAEMQKFRGLWQKIAEICGSVIIQNNFELPGNRPLGNLDSSDAAGKTHFINRLNQSFAEYAAGHTNFYLQDIHYLSAWLGLENWYDNRHWYSYKYAMGLTSIPYLAHNLGAIMGAIWGKSRKALVLDLDNTLWGGIIGEDGLAGIKLGNEAAEGEAFLDFQQYIKELKKRGIILAVCSKNDIENAKQGFGHPDSYLKLDDFSAFEANWKPKHENIARIAHTVNIGEDALVFIDDDVRERELVRSQMPAVRVPKIGEDIQRFAAIIDKSGYFETAGLSAEDLQRNQYYQADVERQAQEAKFKDYKEFLASLEMVAEIGAFSPDYLERITQLINKTNQFNLTTKRYTSAQIESIAKSHDYITLYGRLVDKFGDQGLIACIIGEIKERALHLETWLMSCRVLNRSMESAMFERLIDACEKRSVKEIIGYYFKTPKNSMVAEHYLGLGFELVIAQKNGDMVWKYTVGEKPRHFANAIKVMTC